MAIAGYMLIEGWSFLDAAYMTVVTFTTVGYEEVRPLSSIGRVFTMFLMVAGVGVMLYILTSVVQLMVGAGSAAQPGAEAQNEVAYGKTERALHRMRFRARRQGGCAHVPRAVGGIRR